jgi:hypothetical protein
MKKVKLLLSTVLLFVFTVINACPSSVSVCGTAAVVDAGHDFQVNCTTSSISIVDICDNNRVYTATRNNIP